MFELPQNNLKSPDLALDVDWEDGTRDKVFVNVRPYARRFLRQVATIYEVVIFTASVINYAK